MYKENLSFEEALEKGASLPYLMKTEKHSFYLGKNIPFNELSHDNLVELRFFDEDQEIRVFANNRENGWCAALIKKAEGDCCLEKRYLLENKQFGRSISVRTFLEPDEDGQMNATAICLCGWEGGNE